MSGFPSQFTKHYFVAAYLYANKSAKDAPVALIETYVFMFSVFARAMLRRLSTGGFRDCKQHANQNGKGPRQDGSALC